MQYKKSQNYYGMLLVFASFHFQHSKYLHFTKISPKNIISILAMLKMKTGKQHRIIPQGFFDFPMFQLFHLFYTTYMRCITKSNQNQLKLCKVILIFITNHFLLQFLCKGTPCLKSGRVKLARASPQGWGFVVSCKCRSEKQTKKLGAPLL